MTARHYVRTLRRLSRSIGLLVDMATGGAWPITTEQREQLENAAEAVEHYAREAAASRTSTEAQANGVLCIEAARAAQALACSLDDPDVTDSPSEAV